MNSTHVPIRWHESIYPQTSERGKIHLSKTEPSEAAVRTHVQSFTACGRWLVLLPLSYLAEDDVMCKTCERVAPSAD